jgi:hypothetical protein
VSSAYAALTFATSFIPAGSSIPLATFLKETGKSQQFGHKII